MAREDLELKAYNAFQRYIGLQIPINRLTPQASEIIGYMVSFAEEMLEIQKDTHIALIDSETGNCVHCWLPPDAPIHEAKTEKAPNPHHTITSACYSGACDEETCWIKWKARFEKYDKEAKLND